MMDYHALPIGDKIPEQVNAFIEIPAGTHNKYEYDAELGIMKLDRVLHSPFFYPVDYGFFPQTLADDGDPLDVMVVTDAPTFPGCLSEVRPIGIMHMVDGGEGDDKVIAVQASNPHYSSVKKLSDLEPHILEEITHFFSQYKHLEKKEVEVKEWADQETAFHKIKEAHQAYLDQHQS